MPAIATVLAPGFEETEAITVIDLLRRAKITVTVLGLGVTEVPGAHGITVIADKLFSDWDGACDGIVLPGGMPGTTNLAASSILLERIRTIHAQGGLCAAICAAPLVLARAGILKGVQATCYPGMEHEIAGAVVTEKPVLRDGNIITSQGVGTAIPFALELIAYLINREMSQRIAEGIVYTE